MKVTINTRTPTPEEISNLIGRQVTQMTVLPEESIELDIAGTTPLTQTQKQALADRLNIHVSRISSS